MTAGRGADRADRADRAACNGAGPAGASDRILLRRMVFEGRHGVPDEERRTPQPIEVTVALEADLAHAGRSDDLARSVDYSAVFDLVRRIVEERSFRLLEAIAETVAAEILATHPLVRAVTVTVDKPRVPLAGHIESAGVEIHRRRSESLIEQPGPAPAPTDL